jgi:hypothetical protein
MGRGLKLNLPFEYTGASGSSFGLGHVPGML